MLLPTNMFSGSKSIIARKTSSKHLEFFMVLKIMIDGKVFSPIVNNDKLYDEYAIFKRQANMEWVGKDNLDVCGMIN